MMKRKLFVLLAVVLCALSLACLAEADEDRYVDIYIPEGTKVIEEEAFAGIRGKLYLSLPDGVQHIESRAFADMELDYVSFPDSVSYIADDAFGFGNDYVRGSAPWGSYALQWMTDHVDYFDFTDGPLTFGDWEYSINIEKSYRNGVQPSVTLTAYNGSEKDLIVPDSINGIPVTRISMWRWDTGNEPLETLVLPGTIEQIDSETFSRYPSLRSVAFLENSNNVVFYSSFRNCPNLRTVILPTACAFYDDAFSGCPNLTVTCTAHSAAEAYCLANGIACVTTASPFLFETEHNSVETWSEDDEYPFSFTYRVREADVHCVEVDYSPLTDVWVTLTAYSGSEAVADNSYSRLPGLCSSNKPITSVTLEGTAWKSGFGVAVTGIREYAVPPFSLKEVASNEIAIQDIQFTQRIMLHYSRTYRCDFSVIDAQGEAVFTKSLSSTSALNSISITWTPGCPPGDYTLRTELMPYEENSAEETLLIERPVKVLALLPSLDAPEEACLEEAISLTVSLQGNSQLLRQAKQRLTVRDSKGNTVWTSGDPVHSYTNKLVSVWQTDAETLLPGVYTITAETFDENGAAYESVQRKITLKKAQVTQGSAFTYVFIDEQDPAAGVCITGYSSYYNNNGKGTLVFPETLDGYPVRGIGNGSTLISGYCPSVIVIPDSVTFIGNYAFTKKTSVGLNYQYTATPIVKVTMSSNVKSIGDYAFYKSESLTAIELPASLKQLGASAFKGCKGLESAAFQEGLTSIGAYAFDGCTALKTIRCPESLIYVGEYAFTSVSTLYLGSQVQLKSRSLGVASSYYGNMEPYYPDLFDRFTPGSYYDTPRIYTVYVEPGTSAYYWAINERDAEKQTTSYGSLENVYISCNVIVKDCEAFPHKYEVSEVQAVQDEISCARGHTHKVTWFCTRCGDSYTVTDSNTQDGCWLCQFLSEYSDTATVPLDKVIFHERLYTAGNGGNSRAVSNVGYYRAGELVKPYKGLSASSSASKTFFVDMDTKEIVVETELLRKLFVTYLVYGGSEQSVSKYKENIVLLCSRSAGSKQTMNQIVTERILSEELGMIGGSALMLVCTSGEFGTEVLQKIAKGTLSPDHFAALLEMECVEQVAETISTLSEQFVQRIDSLADDPVCSYTVALKVVNEYSVIRGYEAMHNELVIPVIDEFNKWTKGSVNLKGLYDFAKGALAVVMPDEISSLSDFTMSLVQIAMENSSDPVEALKKLGNKYVQAHFGLAYDLDSAVDFVFTAIETADDLAGSKKTMIDTYQQVKQTYSYELFTADKVAEIAQTLRN